MARAGHSGDSLRTLLDAAIADQVRWHLAERVSIPVRVICWELENRLRYSLTMPLSPGTRLGPYEIVSPLGSGGMGEVYRARDSRLGREVAVKVLPAAHTANPEVRARFEREARTVSALSHPHICTLFDVGREGATDYLVMELLDGETLAQRLARGPLPLADVVKLGSQIADALDRAHRAGVVHRDLKPGNIMLTRTGAKLLDFGLARATGLAGNGGTSGGPSLTYSPTIATPLTAEGTIVGTFQYMAPEQLEGKEADARADLWALGCVLYEMVTGARAFAGDSQASLIAAIMTGEPRPVTELQPVSPAALEQVIRRCLKKDPDVRLQSARDLAFVLELAVASVPAPQPVATAAASGATRRLLPLATILVLVAAVGFFTGRRSAPRPAPGAVRVATLSQGTRDGEPAVSRDGRLVAFNAVRQNGQGLWLMDMVTRSEVKLTNAIDRLPRFTADNGSIVFTRNERERQSLWRIPVIGGTPRLLVEDAFDADPSPDGQRIAYLAGAQSDSAGMRMSLMVARTDGSEARALWTRSSVVIGSPRWSPDGKRIAFTLTGGQNAPNQLVIVEVANGASRDIPSPNQAVLSNAEWDGTGHGLVVAEGVGVTAIQRGAPGRLYRLDARTARYRELGSLENFPSFVNLLPDGRLVMSSFVARQNLREAAVGARDFFGSRLLTSGMSLDRQPVYSPDGKSIVFSSNRGGSLDLWEVSVESGEMHRLTDDPADDWDPAFSPDGRSLYWCSNRSGAFEIWTARRDATSPRQVSRDSVDAENPSVSPDQKWLIYSSAHPRKFGLWRIPVAGGEGEHLMNTATLIPELSPDGRYISVISEVGTPESRLSVYDLEERRALPAGVPLQVVSGTVQVGRARFTADGQAVAFVHARPDGQGVLVLRPVSAWRDGSGRTDTLFAASTETVESFGFSPDGKRVVVSLVDWLSSLTITDRVAGIVPPRQAGK